MELEAQFCCTRSIQVILGEPLTDLSRSHSNDRIRRCIVVQRPAEDFNADQAFFDLLRRSLKNFAHHEAKEPRIPLAVSEGLAGQNSFELLADELG